MLDIDMEGNKRIERPVYRIETDSYEGIIRSVSDIFKSKKYQSDEMVNKLSITVGFPQFKYEDVCVNKEQVSLEPDEVQFPLFMTAKISKGGVSSTGKAYRSSKLYTIIEMAGLLPEFTTTVLPQLNAIEDKEEKAKKFLDWLRDKIVGRKVKGLIELKKGTKGEYSRLKDINRFIDENSELVEGEETVNPD